MGTLGAQEVDSFDLRIDSSKVTLKEFKGDLSDRYDDRDFNYKDSVEGQAENFIARAINWFFSKLGDLFGVQISPETQKFLELLIYIVLIILAIVLIARLLSGSDAGALFSRKNAAINQFNVREEHIERIDFEALIAEALAQQNYRLALRYRFLKLLKELSQKGHIQWHYEKTNSDYYTELKRDSLKQGFRDVSYLFEYVWYGEFPLDEHGYQRAGGRFDELTKYLGHAE